MASESFQQWGLDFIEMINPYSSSSNEFILTTIEYFTRWTKEAITKNMDQYTIMEFM